MSCVWDKLSGAHSNVWAFLSDQAVMNTMRNNKHCWKKYLSFYPVKNTITIDFDQPELIPLHIHKAKLRFRLYDGHRRKQLEALIPHHHTITDLKILGLFDLKSKPVLDHLLSQLSQLKHLKINEDYEENISFLPLLPSTLEYLKIENLNHFDQNFIFTNPSSSSSLTELHIITTLTIEPNVLPHTLMKLSTLFIEKGLFAKDVLPPHLTYLKTDGIAQLHPCFLPTGLKHFFLSTKCMPRKEHFDITIGLLPNGLETFEYVYNYQDGCPMIWEDALPLSLKRLRYITPDQSYYYRKLGHPTSSWKVVSYPYDKLTNLTSLETSQLCDPRTKEEERATMNNLFLQWDKFIKVYPSFPLCSSLTNLSIHNWDKRPNTERHIPLPLPLKLQVLRVSSSHSDNGNTYYFYLDLTSPLPPVLSSSADVKFAIHSNGKYKSDKHHIRISPSILLNIDHKDYTNSEETVCMIE